MRAGDVGMDRERSVRNRKAATNDSNHSKGSLAHSKAGEGDGLRQQMGVFSSGVKEMVNRDTRIMKENYGSEDLQNQHSLERFGVPELVIETSRVANFKMKKGSKEL
ncbi:hypothetical protein ACOSQ2_009850 [Xanthoceras sorbifolium]